MAFGTVSDPFVAAALWTACGAFALSLVLLFATVVMRVRLLRRLARETRLASRWNPLIAECAERAPPSVPKVARRDAEAVLVLWARAQETLRGEARENLVKLAIAAAMPTHADRMLRSGNPRLELLAVVVFGHLRDQARLPVLAPLIRKAGTLLSLAAAQALLRIDESKGISLLLAAAARRDDWALAPVAAILKDADPARVAVHLVAAIRTERQAPGPGPGLARLLRLHGTAHAESLRPAVLEVLARPEPAEVLAAALSALWHPADADRARDLVDHGNWIVRVAAAHALRRVGTLEDVRPLSRLLGDGNWWVRHRAAQALCALPDVGPDEILKLRATLKDRFAADALAQALADRAP